MSSNKPVRPWMTKWCQWHHLLHRELTGFPVAQASDSLVLNRERFQGNHQIPSGGDGFSVVAVSTCVFIPSSNRLRAHTSPSHCHAQRVVTWAQRPVPVPERRITHSRSFAEFSPGAACLVAFPRNPSLPKVVTL